MNNEDRLLIFCGDIHGELKELVYKLAEQYKIENADVVILGDFGVGFDKTLDDTYNRIKKRLNKNDINLYTIRGNHDDPSFFINPKNYPRLEFLEDHKVYNISGRKIYTIGGANSTDIEDRLKDNEIRKKKHKLPCWWEGEVIDKKYNDLPGRVDIIISHEAPLCFEPVVRREFLPDYQLKNIVESRKYLNYVLDSINTDYWFYGHYHKSYAGSYNNVVYRCLGIMELFEAPNKITHNPQGKIK